MQAIGAWIDLIEMLSIVLRIDLIVDLTETNYNVGITWDANLWSERDSSSLRNTVLGMAFDVVAAQDLT